MAPASRLARSPGCKRGVREGVAVVFTSVVAPVLVHVAVRDSNGDKAPPRRDVAAPVKCEAVSRPGDAPAGSRPETPPIGIASLLPAPPAAVAPPAVILQVVA